MSLFCTVWRRRISRALDGREPGLAALSAHLLACESCRTYAEAVEEDGWRLERALASRHPTWTAETMGLEPAPAARPFLPLLPSLPSWAPRTLGTALIFGLLGTLVLSSGPFILVMGALPVELETGDLTTAATLLGTLFGGALLLRSRRFLQDSLEGGLLPVPVLGRAMARSVPIAAAAFLTTGVGILLSYAQITRTVWM